MLGSAPCTWGRLQLWGIRIPMFDRLKKVFVKGADAASTGAPATPLEQWARAMDYVIARKGRTEEFSMTGQVAGRPFRLDRSAPSRAYIHGHELRARVELDADPAVAVMLINRPLRDALEAKAYENYTDSLQTTLDAGLPEEVRWLAMYDEVGWETGAVPGFWSRYCTVADGREHAQAWVDAELMQVLLDWPDATPALPLILMLQRGKLYLRMQFTPADLVTLQQVMRLLEQASASAVRPAP